MTAGSSSTSLQPPHSARPARVRWTRGRKALFGAIGFGSTVIAGAGFVGSYTAVRALAEEKGFGSFAPAFPLAVDLGIAVLLALDLALTSINLKYPLLRYIAWLLTAATITFNAASSWPDVLGSAMHATIPLLFIAVTEAMRNAIAKATSIELDQHMDSIRLSRWFLSPVATFSIWRDMKLWEIRSYALALQRYQERMLLRQDLRAEYGRGWRRKATSAQLAPLRQARLGIAVERGATDVLVVEQMRDEVPVQALAPVQSLRPAPQGPAVVLKATAALAPQNLPATPAPVADAVQARAVVPEQFAPMAPDPASQPAVEAVAPIPATREELVEPGLDVGTPQSGPAPVAAAQSGDPVAPRGVDAAGYATGESAREEPETADDAEDDEAAGGEMEEPRVDVGVAPPGETKGQRAERIYLAHQQAGVELTKPNLARWAGYQQEGSGRTQYNKLEKTHGPIVVREGADQLDLDWRQPGGQDAGLRPAEPVR